MHPSSIRTVFVGWDIENYGAETYKALTLIVGVILDDALLNKDTAILLPFGLTEAKQHSHDELLNPITPANV